MIDVIRRLTGLRDLAYYATNVAPHALTTRASRTIPANTHGYIPSIFMLARRRTTAAATPFVYMVANYTPSGGTTRPIAELYMFGNATSDWVCQAFPIDLMLLPGDTIAFSTLDDSTGGSVDYTIRAILYEFW